MFPLSPTDEALLDRYMENLRPQTGTDPTEFSARIHWAARAGLSRMLFKVEHKAKWQSFLVAIGAIEPGPIEIDFTSLPTNEDLLNKEATISLEPGQAARLKKFVSPTLKDDNGNWKDPLSTGDVLKAFFAAYRKYLEAIKKDGNADPLAQDPSLKLELQADFVVYMQWAMTMDPELEKKSFGKFRLRMQSV